MKHLINPSLTIVYSKHYHKHEIKILMQSFILATLVCFSNAQVKAQNSSVNLVFLQADITGNLNNLPDFTVASAGFYPASWNTLQISDIPFSGWLHAEAYGNYNSTLDYTIIVDNPNQSSTIVEVEVLYHRNYGRPNQTTKSIGKKGDQLFYAGFRQELPRSISLDLDSLDGSKMDVIECIHRVNGVQTANSLTPIVVSGLVSREVPPDGSLVTPQIPYLILHDPPGDASSSTFVGGEKICREVTNTYQEEIGGGFTATGKIGLAGSIGVVLEQGFEFSVAVTQDFKMTHRNLTEQTNERCIEITNSFSTSDLPGNIGPDADIFIGYGETWIYGTYEEVVVPAANEITAGEDSASIYKGLAYAQDSGAGKTTTFIKTTKDIEEDIKQQFSVANDLSNSELTRTRAYNQMKVWEQVLALNADNVANASVQFGNNYNFSGTTNSSFDQEITTTQSTTLTYDVAIETGTSITFTAIVGANGFTGGPQFTFNKNEGVTTSNSTVNKELINYTLSDDDALDNFPISVFKDPTYGTPIFRLNNGTRTSYPYEGGYRRDQPKLLSEISICSSDLGIVNNVPYGSSAIFDVYICNESDEQRDYRLQLNNGSNDNGAIVRSGGDVIDSGNDFLNFTVAAGSCDTIKVTVQRNPDYPLPGQFGYEAEQDIYDDIVLILYPYKVLDDSTFPLEAVEYTAKVNFGPNTVFIDDACNIAQSCYDFENLDYAPVAEQDNWKVFNAVQGDLSTQPSIVLLPDTLGTRSLVGPADGFLLTYMSRKNDNNFSLPSMGPCSQQIYLEFDMFFPIGQSFNAAFRFGADADNDGNITFLPGEAGFGLNVSHQGSQVNLQCYDASGGGTGAEAIIALFSDTYFRFRMEVLPGSNSGSGIANLYFKNLTDGGPWLKAVNIDDVALGFNTSDPTSASNISNIDGFSLQLQNSMANIDNICVTNINYQTSDCSDCLDNILVSQPIIADDAQFESAKSILANGIISGSSNVRYSANERIELQKGFNVQNGSQLIIDLNGCTTPALNKGIEGPENSDEIKSVSNSSIGPKSE